MWRKPSFLMARKTFCLLVIFRRFPLLLSRLPVSTACRAEYQRGSPVFHVKRRGTPKAMLLWSRECEPMWLRRARFFGVPSSSRCGRKIVGTPELGISSTAVGTRMATAATSAIQLFLVVCVSASMLRVVICCCWWCCCCFCVCYWCRRCCSC